MLGGLSGGSTIFAEMSIPTIVSSFFTFFFTFFTFFTFSVSFSFFSSVTGNDLEDGKWEMQVETLQNKEKKVK